MRWLEEVSMRWLMPVLCLAWPAVALAAPALSGKTYLSVEGPTGKSGMAGAPVLQSITALYDVTTKSGRRVDIMPQFHFMAPNGNAVLLHRELMETDSAITQAGIRDAPIAIPADQQRAGAVVRGGWPCGPGRYHVTLRAWLEDAAGKRGNAIQYTIHCHELLMY
jgi:hypothetical protein